MLKPKIDVFSRKVNKTLLYSIIILLLLKNKIRKLRCLGTAFSQNIAVMLVISQKLEISDWLVPTTGFGVK